MWNTFKIFLPVLWTLPPSSDIPTCRVLDLVFWGNCVDNISATVTPIRSLNSNDVDRCLTSGDICLAITTYIRELFCCYHGYLRLHIHHMPYTVFCGLSFKSRTQRLHFRGVGLVSIGWLWICKIYNISYRYFKIVCSYWLVHLHKWVNCFECIQVGTSVVWPDPWMGCARFARAIKGLVTLTCITCASTTIAVEPIKVRRFIKWRFSRKWFIRMAVRPLSFVCSG